MTEPFARLLDEAIASRGTLFDSRHEGAFRLFNGFTEGEPHLSVDLYAGSVIFYNYAADVSAGMALVQEAQSLLRTRLPWLKAGIVKIRNAATREEKRGQLLFGETLDRKITEFGVRYAVNLTMNRDASFYLDTRGLRKWLIEHSAGKIVLNAFAYTGSLGVAALAGGASRVVQLDRNRSFLNLGKDSYSLNSFPVHKADFIAADFFTQIAKFKRTGQAFDCVLVDPPFFSTTSRGKVDQENGSARLINKVRPLIKDGGSLVAVNNALYVSGSEYMHTLESLCADGYVTISELIPVPDDFVGFNKIGMPITDPAPFNHSTKIAVLEVRRKTDHF